MGDGRLNKEWLAFTRAIQAAPDDMGLRLILADWLETDGGNPLLAEFIRLGSGDVSEAHLDRAEQLLKGKTFTLFPDWPADVRVETVHAIIQGNRVIATVSHIGLKGHYEGTVVFVGGLLRELHAEDEMWRELHPILQWSPMTRATLKGPHGIHIAYAPMPRFIRSLSKLEVQITRTVVPDDYHAWLRLIRRRVPKGCVVETY